MRRGRSFGLCILFCLFGAATAVIEAGCGSADSPDFRGADGGGSGGSAGAGASGSSGAGASAGSDGSAGASGQAGSAGSFGSGGSGAVDGSAATAGSAGSGGASGNAGAAGSGGSSGACFRATRLWFEDWETGDYSRWTSRSYDNDWGNSCQSNGISNERSVSPSHANRSEITCAYTSEGNVHRGYGGVQFEGDRPVPAFNDQGQGIDAPNGLVNTFHVWLETSTTFTAGKWFSFWTVNGSCDWSEDVLTLGLEDPSRRLAAAHYQPEGGTRTFAPNAPGVPLRQWVRITIYVNYHAETMSVWQNGTKISDVTFRRASTRICQWHWGAYASGDNDDVVLFEDDNSIWKLEQPWTDFAREPWFGNTQPVCP
jgi:hypothetical protein